MKTPTAKTAETQRQTMRDTKAMKTALMRSPERVKRMADMAQEGAAS
jgi:hypothetical protein